MDRSSVPCPADGCGETHRACQADGCGKPIEEARARAGAAYCGPGCRMAQKNRRAYERRAALIKRARELQ